MATQNIGNKVGFSFFERESDFSSEMKQTLADNIVFLKDAKKIVTHGTEFSGGKYLKQADLTTYNTAVNGEIVQHIGATDGTYTNGYVYKRVESSETMEGFVLSDGPNGEVIETVGYELYSGQRSLPPVSVTLPNGTTWSTTDYRRTYTLTDGRKLLLDDAMGGDSYGVIFNDDNTYTIYYCTRNSAIPVSSWTRIDVQPGVDSDIESRVSTLEDTTIKQGDAIESPSGTQSLSVTDDYIDAGHYSDTTVSNAALILGNGTSSEPHNAATIDWNGNAVFDGDITDGDGNKLSDKAECISLTQTEYDNLTSEEQNNGKIYLIKDAEFHSDSIISVYSPWSITITQNSSQYVDYWGYGFDSLNIPSGYEVMRYNVELSIISGDTGFSLCVGNTNAYDHHLCVAYNCSSPMNRQYSYRIKATCLKIS